MSDRRRTDRDPRKRRKGEVASRASGATAAPPVPAAESGPAAAETRSPAPLSSTSLSSTPASRTPARSGRGAAKPASLAALAPLAPVVLIFATLLAYAGSLDGVFLFDDQTAVVENESIRSPFSIWKALSPPRDTTVAGRPLPNLSLAFNHALGGLDPRGYIAFNVAVHLGAGLLLFALVRGTLRLPRLAERFPGRRPDGLAFAVALLWLVHPIQTESVTYVCQRVESIMGFLYLATFVAFLGAATSARPFPWRVATVLCSLLGMASKEVMATAPPLLLLFDRAFLAGSWREVLERRMALHGAVWATLLLLFALMATSPRGDSAGFGMTGEKRITSVEYARTQPAVVLHYLRLLAWPEPLVLDYSWPVAKDAREILPPAAGLLALLAASAWLLWRSPPAGFCAAWFFLILAPTSTIVPIADLAFEHRIYLPMAGPIALAAVALEGALRRIVPRAAAPAGLALALAAGLVFAALTARRNEAYESSERMYRDVIEKRPENARGHNNLGKILFDADRFAEALTPLAEAVRLDPDYLDAWRNLASVQVALGDLAGAKDSLAQALRISPRDAEATARMELLLDPATGARRLIEASDAYMAAGRRDDALRNARFATLLAPDSPAILGVAGVILAEAGLPEEATGLFRRATELAPADPDAWLNLASASMESRRFAEAESAFARALELAPSEARAREGLAAARSMLRRSGAASR